MSGYVGSPSTNNRIGRDRNNNGNLSWEKMNQWYLGRGYIKNEKGKATYTQMLNSDGGIETDLTVICLDKNYFRIVSSAATRERDKFHIKKHLSKEIELRDVTDDYCVFGLFGPKSRDLIKTISNENFENDNFKFGTGKYITIESIKVWTQRLSYVGELGYELYVEFKDAKKIYELIIDKVKILIFLIVVCTQWIL